MINERLNVSDFTNADLRAALKFYTECMNDGYKPQRPDFQAHFHCSHQRAEVLLKAASWAYRVQQKEKAQFEAKRKRAC